MARRYKVKKVHPFLALLAGGAAAYPQHLRAEAEKGYRKEALGLEKEKLLWQKKYQAGQLAESKARREQETRQAKLAQDFTLKRDEALSTLSRGDTEASLRLQNELRTDFFKITDPNRAEMAAKQLEKLDAEIDAIEAGVRLRGEELDLAEKRAVDSTELGWARVDATKRGQDLQLAVANLNLAGQSLFREYDALTSQLAAKGIKFNDYERHIFGVTDSLLKAIAANPENKVLQGMLIGGIKEVQRISASHGQPYPIDVKVKDGVFFFRDVPLVRRIPGLGRKVEVSPSEAEPAAPPTETLPALLKMLAPRIKEAGGGFAVAPGGIQRGGAELFAPRVEPELPSEPLGPPAPAPAITPGAPTTSAELKTFIGNTIASSAAGVGLPFVMAMIKQESAFNPQISSSAGAVGLMQLMPATARSVGLKVGEGVDERLDPMKNIQGGLKYLRWLKVNFDVTTEERLLAAYNAGPARLRGNAYKKIAETRGYIAAVAKNAKQYRDNPSVLQRDIDKLYKSAFSGTAVIADPEFQRNLAGFKSRGKKTLTAADRAYAKDVLGWSPEKIKRFEDALKE